MTLTFALAGMTLPSVELFLVEQLLYLVTLLYVVSCRCQLILDWLCLGEHLHDVCIFKPFQITLCCVIYNFLTSRVTQINEVSDANIKLKKGISILLYDKLCAK